MKCLETRDRRGMRWRRYKTDDGSIEQTFEVPASVMGYISKATLERALDLAAKSAARRALHAKARHLLSQGWKPVAVAHTLGMPDSTVRGIRGRVQGTNLTGSVNKSQMGK